MSQRFGPVRQNGYVVPDIQAAIRHWAEVLGVGPWRLLETTNFDPLLYRGQPTSAQAAIALANSGDLQIELIQPLDAGPSPYNDFLKATDGQGGLQHLSSWPEAAFYDQALAAFRADGGEVLFEGAAGRTRFVYLDTAQDFGTIFEMAALSPGSRKVYADLKARAANWDGREIILAD